MTQRLRWKIGDQEFEVEGPPEFVEAQLTRFLERVGAGVTRVTRSGNVPAQIVAATSGGKAPSPAEYYRSKNPSSGTETLIVLAKYLDEFRSIPEFGGAEIQKIAGEAKLKNIHSQYFTMAVKQGLLRSPKKGRYALTISGEDVVAAMPAGGGNDTK